MAMLIAEIGGSSSRWALLDGDAPAMLFPLQGEGMPGLNPLSGDPELFAQGIRSYFLERQPVALNARAVIAYGAGCGTPERAAIMEGALRQLWPAASISVSTDLEGAARGLWSDGSGLVIVLGTGSSVGWFDGARLHQRFPSLGYVLGDEGSGADIGRALLQDAFYRRMPDDLRAALFGEEGPSLSAVLEEVYRSPFPSRALAAHAGRLAAFLHEDYVRELITARFEAFIEAFKPFHPAEQREQVRATGSVAWGFREILADRLLDHGMELQSVERDPLNGLVAWHRRPIVP
jgi:N-acetylglucosamine kinase-like BadF-type ATPase